MNLVRLQCDRAAENRLTVNRVELAAMMSEVSERSIEAGEPLFDEWAQAARIPDRLHENLRVMYEDYNLHGFPGGNALVLRTILGRSPRSLQQYVRELASRKVT